jgi:phospholipid transport system transporter-binding protein
VSEAEVEVRRAGEARIELVGTLSFETVPRVREKALALLPRSGEALMDLSAVRSSDSAGVALLIDLLAQAVGRDVSLRFSGLPPQVMALARINGLDDLLPVSNGPHRPCTTESL